jgi:hypothetical protein
LQKRIFEADTSETHFHRIYAAAAQMHVTVESRSSDDAILSTLRNVSSLVHGDATFLTQALSASENQDFTAQLNQWLGTIDAIVAAAR